MMREHGWRLRRGKLTPVTAGAQQNASLLKTLNVDGMRLRHVSQRKVGMYPPPPPDYEGDRRMWQDRPRRSGVHKESVARALLIRGLVSDGLSHRAAIRTWLGWEIELEGPWSKRRSLQIAARQLRAGDFYALRDFEESRAADDRSLWRALGIDPDTEPNQN
jgi:hypothetical protein